MSKPLLFLMGRAPVLLPTDRQYVRNHLWAQAGEDRHRFGLTAYAVKLLGEVRHLRWSVEPGESLTAGQPIGYVEASKATSDLFAPMAGRLQELNPAVLSQPRLVNTAVYDAGWLLSIAGPLPPPLLSPAEYVALLEATWPMAQRLLKGQSAF